LGNELLTLRDDSSHGGLELESFGLEELGLTAEGAEVQALLQARARRLHLGHQLS
jgi:hypothetical protein